LGQGSLAVRITLDYYRILNVSIKADLDRLNQAYQDRLQQQPRREYSSNAIANRQKIIEQAYSILSDPDKRAEYDHNFFDPEKSEKSESLANQNPNSESDLLERAAIAKKAIAIDPYIEIEPELLVGTLMILHELAEYEVVLRLGNEYLQELEQAQSYQSFSSSVSKTTTQTSVIAEQKPDILLCLALSYLDLSREQWQREEFENAAISGNLGIKLLQQENSLFLRLQKEIEAELNLLKPYRILELLEQNPPGSSLRVRGLQLLQEMLQQREGIEGKNNDISGLKSDQFLHFIQQIRTYLTLQEQKELFLAETRRGSHPGSCLAAYALIAEGYTQKKPSSILQAQKILQNLSQSKQSSNSQSSNSQSYSAKKLQGQNTHWERAMCALLLGQTVESQAIIQQSEDTKTLNLIQQYSSESPDLLPGLCFYGQQWLQKKVLAQFKDLQSSQISLGDYYNDPAVQLFIENISPITDRDRYQDRHQDRQSVASQPASAENAEQITNANEETNKSHSMFPWWSQKKATNQTTSFQTASYKTNYSPVKTATTSSNFVSVGSQSRESSPTLPNQYQSSKVTGTTTNSVNTPAVSFPIERDRVAFTQSPQTKRQKKSASRKYWKNGLFLVGLIGGIGTLGFVLTQWRLETSSKKSIVFESVTPSANSSSNQSDSSATAKTATPADVKPKTTAKATVKPSTIEVFNQALAQKLVQKWLDSKAAALGQKYQANQLDSILTGSLLAQWRDTAKYYQQNNIYRQFEHQVNIRSYKVNPQNSNRATVETEVNEVAQHYQKGQIDRSQSYSDRLIVRYELVRQKDRWLIESSKVVQSLRS
jgi:curved DNA-binding protein CbpA